MNITELFGKKIYSIFEGEQVGTIASANFNLALNKIQSFKIFDNYDTEYELLFKDIKSINTYVLISNKTKLLPYFDTPSKNPFFKEVINHNAKSLGKITNAEIDNLGNIKNFITELGEVLEPQKMYVKKDFVFYSQNKINMSNYRPKTKVLETSAIKVNILYSETSSKAIPTKLSFNPQLILGKIAKSDLLGKNNEMIIKANQQITEKIIEDATRHNCLNQLFYIAV